MPDVFYGLGDPAAYSLAAGTRLKDGKTLMLDGNPLSDFSAEMEGFFGRDINGEVAFGEAAGPVRTNGNRVDVVDADASINSMAMEVLPKVVSGDFILWFDFHRTSVASNPVVCVGLSNQNYQFDANNTASARSLRSDSRSTTNNILIEDQHAGGIIVAAVIVAGSKTSSSGHVLANGTTVYFSIARVGTTCTFIQYPTAADRIADTNRDWTEVLTGPSTDMSNLYYYTPWNRIPGRRWTGWVDNFQFVGGTYVTTMPFVTGSVLNIADKLAAASALAIEESTPAGSSIQHEYKLDGGSWLTAGTPVADGSSNIAAVAAALNDEVIAASVQLRHGLISATGVVSPSLTIVPSHLLGTLAGGGGGGGSRSGLSLPVCIKGGIRNG